MGQPKQVATGAKIVNLAAIPVGSSIQISPGDCVPHVVHGWHVAILPTQISSGGHGLKVGESNDTWQADMLAIASAVQQARSQRAGVTTVLTTPTRQPEMESRKM